MYVFIVLLAVTAGCARAPEKNLIMMTPPQVQFIQKLDTEYDDLLGLSRDDILLRFGKPYKSRRYTLRGERREQFIYYFAKPGFESEPKTIDIYFKEDRVSGFNMFDGVLTDEQKNKGTLGDQVSLGGV
ncbi:MAG: hypothetical protein JW938_04295 [Candidatus Omnitrophica bacterium]|nr:hypothetical protein [Candidatus Omnitrophota bacterium]